MFLFQTISIKANERPLAVMGPLTLSGPFEFTEQQILFNRLRELLLERYRLVSHKITETIKDRGYSNLDIENCRSSDCVNTVLDFLEDLEKQFKTREYFQLEILRHRTSTRLILKRSDLRYPEIIQQLKTAACDNCKLSQLESRIEELTLELFATLETPPKVIDNKISEKTPLKPDSIEQEKLSEIKEFKVKTPDALNKETNFPLNMEPEEYYMSETVNAVETSSLDPYDIAREDYNASLVPQLLDITYSLQIFRIGLHVLVEVEIDELGKIISKQILQSSGLIDFDETAMLGIDSLELEPLPNPLKRYSSYKVNLRIQNYQ